VKDADGQLSLKTVATIVKDDQDRFPRQMPDEVMAREFCLRRRRRQKTLPLFV